MPIEQPETITKIKFKRWPKAIRASWLYIDPDGAFCWGVFYDPEYQRGQIFFVTPQVYLQLYHMGKFPTHWLSPESAIRIAALASSIKPRAYACK